MNRNRIASRLRKPEACATSWMSLRLVRARCEARSLPRFRFIHNFGADLYVELQ